MASITSLGVGSNLDAESIVSKLMAVEKLPLTQLTTRTNTYNAKISAFGAISSALASLKTAATALESTKTNLLTATVSDSNVASLTTTTSAAPGAYQLEVTQLAKAHTLSSRVISNSSETLGTGQLTISNGSNSFSITVDGTNNTLTGIRDAINAKTENTSVKANVITDAAGSRLVLTSKETGASNTISISVNDNDGNNTDAYDALTNTSPGLSQLAFAGGANNLSQIQAAQNAAIKLDNVSLSFSSNTITDAIAGTTLKLTKENTGTPATITLSRDTAGLKTLADNFVKAYNDLRTQVTKYTAYNAETKTASALTGDSTVRSIDRQLREALRTVPATVTGNLKQLADIGISIDASGTMAVDSSKFEKAVTSNFASTQSILDGYGKALKTTITSLTDTNGVIAARTTGIKSSIKLLDAQKERLNDRLETIEKRYRARFTSLDKLVSSMQTTSTFLSQQIAKWS